MPIITFFFSFSLFAERMKLRTFRRYRFILLLLFSVHLLPNISCYMFNNLNFFFQEISVLSQCRSAYITEYYGSFLNQTKLWIIMEYMVGGSVADLVGYFYWLASIFSMLGNDVDLLQKLPPLIEHSLHVFEYFHVLHS